MTRDEHEPGPHGASVLSFSLPVDWDQAEGRMESLSLEELLERASQHDPEATIPARLDPCDFCTSPDQSPPA